MTTRTTRAYHTRKLAALALLALVATGCAANASRMGVYPAQGQNVDQTLEDMGACDAAAKRITGSMGAETATGAAVGVAAGAVIGATLGAIAGAFFGLAGEGAAIGAALGGATGGIQGAGGGAATNQQVFAANYAACLSGRGYSVAR